MALSVKLLCCFVRSTYLEYEYVLSVTPDLTRRLCAGVAVCVAMPGFDVVTG